MIYPFSSWWDFWGTVIVIFLYIAGYLAFILGIAYAILKIAKYVLGL